MPNGVACRDGALYVAEVNRVLRYDDIESHLDDPPEPVVIRDDFPTDRAPRLEVHRLRPRRQALRAGRRALQRLRAGGPVYASITRMNPDGSDREIFARGIRNTVGFDWNPDTGVLWFTDNGRDKLGDNRRPTS